VEKLPGGTQLFSVTVGALRTSQFIWSVNGVDGGDAQFGTINVDGLYTSPATVPSPSKFKVCARDAAAPTLRDGCATVIIKAVPSVGADMIVVNDLDVFDSIATQSGGNVRFIRNLVNFSGTGPRASQKGVLYDRSKGDCLIDTACGDPMLARMDAIFTTAGYSVAKLDAPGTILTAIPADVKLLVLWLPKVAYSVTEVNTLKRFAAEGGRILFIGEHVGYYTDVGIGVENQLLLDMGSQMVNLGSFYDCFNDTTGATPTLSDFILTPPASLRSHPLLTGVGQLAYLCASELQAGPNDYPLFYDTLNVHLLAGVAKIDLTPLNSSAVRTSAVWTNPTREARRSDPYGGRRRR
jgi:hypothetical protein